MKLEAVIGLEFHVQLKTKTKMFCSCQNEFDVNKPNKNICPICLGHPGTLPVINAEAVKMAITAGLALNCVIQKQTKFDRKNYFYPDLPKGYQISQYDEPLAREGNLVINNVARDGLSGRLDDESQLVRIGIERLHMEEDSAKSIHGGDSTLVDYNRGGAPLIEIVTKPHFRTPQEAKTFAQELRLIMRHLSLSDADMEKGHLRCDANISLRPEGTGKLYPKTEIKNINSFRALEKALQFEIERQTLLWHAGMAPETQETRGWDDNKQETVSQRTKEGESDYRYFPEPDLPPLFFSDDEIEEAKRSLGELPQAKRRRFMDQYGFNGEDAKVLTMKKSLANFTEAVISELREWLNSVEEGTDEEIWSRNQKSVIKLVSGWLVNRLLPELETQKLTIAKSKVTPENLAEFITLLHERKINSASAQVVLKEMVKTGADPSQILEEKDLGKMNNEKDFDELIKTIIKNNSDQVAQYKAGKEAVLKFLVGQVMKESKGKADPIEAEKTLKKQIKK